MPGKPLDSSHPIRVTFRQSGGFGGLVLGADLDTRTLPARDAAQLRSLVENSRLLAQPAPRVDVPASPGMRDVTHYELEVETDAGVKALRFDDASTPPDLESLLEFIQARARARPLR